MTNTTRPEEIKDDALDQAGGHGGEGHKQWIPILSVDQGTHRVTPARTGDAFYLEFDGITDRR